MGDGFSIHKRTISYFYRTRNGDDASSVSICICLVCVFLHTTMVWLVFLCVRKTVLDLCVTEQIRLCDGYLWYSKRRCSCVRLCNVGILSSRDFYLLYNILQYVLVLKLYDYIAQSFDKRNKYGVVTRSKI